MKYPSNTGNEKPLISVIVPIYNQAKFIAHGIESLQQQTYSHLQIILVDDGSTDESGKLCDQYAADDKRIQVIHQANQGVSAARNAGLRVARGEYIGFMDGDDYVLPDMYESLYKLVMNHQAQVAMSGFKTNIATQKSPDGCFEIVDFLCNNLRCLSVCNKLFATCLLTDLLFEKRMNHAEDMIFCFQALSRAEKIACTDKSYYCYVENMNSATHGKFGRPQLAALRFYKILSAGSFCKQHVKLAHALKMYQVYGMVGWIRKFIEQEYPKKYVYRYFIGTIRTHIIFYLFTDYPLLNRLFALSCAVNFTCTKWIYQIIKNINLAH